MEDTFNQKHNFKELRRHKLGTKIIRQEWIKVLNIGSIQTEYIIKSEQSCRMFRLTPHLNQSHNTFLRIDFQDKMNQQRYSDCWEYGTMTRYQTQQLLLNGIILGNAKYQLFFYSDSNLRDKKVWMYSCELSHTFHHIASFC